MTRACARGTARTEIKDPITIFSDFQGKVLKVSGCPFKGLALWALHESPQHTHARGNSNHKVQLDKIMKAQNVLMLSKASLPVYLLIIQKLEEMSSCPLAALTRPAEPALSSEKHRTGEAPTRCLLRSFWGYSPLASELLTCIVKTWAIQYYKKVGHTPLRNNHTAPRSHSKWLCCDKVGGVWTQWKQNFYVVRSILVFTRLG